MKSSTIRRMIPAALAALLAACGGGGGSGDSGGNSGGGGNPPGGTSTTRIVTGAISGFGSIIVNGVHYETGSASVSKEGRSSSADALKVGEVVRIEASVDSQGRASAKSVEQGRLVQGTVQAVDVAAGTLTIGGVIVSIDGDTLFDDSIPGASLAGINVGDRIEVHGFAGATGARATRVEKADAGDTEIEFTGRIVAVDTVARRFTIGTQVVDYSTATLDRIGAGGPAVGDIVEVKGTSFLAGNVLQASRVHKEDGFGGQSGNSAEIEGLVTRFASVTDFDVSGQAVRTTSSTTFLNGPSANLGLNVKVEAEGSFDSAGVLVASKVAFKRSGSVRLSAFVVSVDAAAGTFRALNTTVLVNDDTRKEDKVSGSQSFSLAELRSGDWVEVNGYPDASASGRIVATRLERDDPRNEVELRGPAEQLAAPAFSILGTAVETNAGTEFEDEEVRISSAEFFSRAAGQIVNVDGDWNGATLIADKAEIEREDN